MFTLSSELIIGKFRFSGVNEVKIKRSIHSLVDTATIKLPAKARILSKDKKSSEDVVTAKQFNIGDKVTLRLGYDRKLNEEFRGFVTELKQNTPLEITCEGYSYQLKNKTVNKSWTKAKLKEILSEIVKDTDIRVEVDKYSDIELLNIHGGDKTAFEMIDIVLKATQGSLDAWFIQSDVLKVGFVYVPSGDEMKDVLQQGRVKYRIGYNALQDNDLKVKKPTDLKVIVKNAENKRDRNTDPEKDSKIKKYVLNKMPTEALQKVQDTLKLKESYTGYEGKLTGFLSPFCLPGYKAHIADSRYEDRDGDYFVESVEVSFGINGARRIVEIGPKLSAK